MNPDLNREIDQENIVLPDNYIAMANSSIAMLDMVMPGVSSYCVRGNLSAFDTVDLNLALALELYGSELTDLLIHQEFAEVHKLHARNVEVNLARHQGLQQLEVQNLGLTVIRPEMYQQWQAVQNLLEEQGAQIEISRDIQIDFNTYWGLYNHGLTIPEAWLDFPTRTLLYTQNMCRLVVGSLPNNSESNLTDIMINDLKGKRGQPQKGTIRGDIVLSEMEILGIIGDTEPSKELLFCLDPISAYRKIISNELPSDGEHNDYNYPFVYYAAAGVHIPERHEIVRDLGLLCTIEEVDSLIHRQ